MTEKLHLLERIKYLENTLRDKEAFISQLKDYYNQLDKDQRKELAAAYQEIGGLRSSLKIQGEFNARPGQLKEKGKIIKLNQSI